MSETPSDNINGKEEFLEAVKDKDILCAQISKKKYHLNNNGFYDEVLLYEAKLKCNFSEIDWKIFLEDINFEYQPWYCREFFIEGIVWYKGGGWSDRFSDDNHGDYWVYHSFPKIPEYLQ